MSPIINLIKTNLVYDNPSNYYFYGKFDATSKTRAQAITDFGAKPSQSFEIIFSIQSLKPAGLENTVAVHYGDLRADHPTLGWVG